jgi:hypothetical protein
MRTMVELGNSNCGSRLNAMTRHLQAQPLVRHVQLHASTGCLVVDHDLGDPAALITGIRHHLRGWELADNGERVLVDLDIHDEQGCR